MADRRQGECALGRSWRKTPIGQLSAHEASLPIALASAPRRGSGIEALMRVELLKDAVLTGDDIPTMCLDEDSDFWLETETARVAFDTNDLGFPCAAALDDEGTDLALTAVSGWMAQRGFPVEMEVRQGYVLVFDADGEE